MKLWFNFYCENPALQGLAFPSEEPESFFFVFFYATKGFSPKSESTATAINSSKAKQQLLIQNQNTVAVSEREACWLLFWLEREVVKKREEKSSISDKVSHYYSVTLPPSIRTHLRSGTISSLASGTFRAPGSVSCCSKHKTEETKKEIGREKKKWLLVCSQTVSKPLLLFLGCQETRLTAETKGPADTEDLLLFSSPHHVSSEKKKKKKKHSPPLVYDASEVCLGFKLGVNFRCLPIPLTKASGSSEKRWFFFSFTPELLRRLHLLGFTVQSKVSPGRRVLQRTGSVGSDCGAHRLRLQFCFFRWNDAGRLAACPPAVFLFWGCRLIRQTPLPPYFFTSCFFFCFIFEDRISLPNLFLQ